MNSPLMQVKTSLTTFPSSAEIVSEPLGVVLVISAWNYPFCMSQYLVDLVSYHMVNGIQNCELITFSG